MGSTKKRDHEQQVTVEELAVKIEENETLHMRLFEERKQSKEEAERLLQEITQLRMVANRAQEEATQARRLGCALGSAAAAGADRWGLARLGCRRARSTTR